MMTDILVAGDRAVFEFIRDSMSHEVHYCFPRSKGRDTTISAAGQPLSVFPACVSFVNVFPEFVEIDVHDGIILKVVGELCLT